MFLIFYFDINFNCVHNFMQPVEKRKSLWNLRILALQLTEVEILSLNSYFYEALNA